MDAAAFDSEISLYWPLKRVRRGQTGRHTKSVW